MTPQLPTMTPQEFAGRWHDAGFGEPQGAQSFFNDLCGLVGHATPHTRAIGGTFQFAFILPKPANSGNTRPKNRKAVKPRHKPTRTPPIARPPPLLPDHASLKSRDGNPPSIRHRNPPTAEGTQPQQQLPPTNHARPATPRQPLEETPPRPPRGIG